MPGETNLKILLSKLQPVLCEGDFVFASVDDSFQFDLDLVHAIFREKEGITLILKKEIADSLSLEYNYMASCITLDVHSSLESVGLTAAVSNALAKEKISCNVVAAYYHDHIFVDKQDANRAMKVLQQLTNQNN
ncbi:ACT domain-containing protein [Flagellimonas pacifica]|uniref:Uncharacterized protein n=1 Tax=Flagellimonas pacifica TaxID=1247520 RepID=A0A285MBK7_9FLAO|nr:ACT domain-containing protein [Allomuricauda parva]SNY94545.1 hypothetical protein SAMN06265377_0205 [Allomuricauda parva]